MSVVALYARDPHFPILSMMWDMQTHYLTYLIGAPESNLGDN
ncbi:hypothetical protein AS9A_1228 [Hoyosella subflava DQS3-9A1]|uniref:Uncharacterized protein n=1 Tax=Hoyosella subflava (strain DSM 45089 / JCM 17490 / NBRC 109087 / DQS3-9A1) TaxID=443218 RepID=F6EEI3_HOYSD|nr:hypothetical protein AS9A_1228 [Hoyosella subflava DQS3-9A1]